MLLQQLILNSPSQKNELTFFFFHYYINSKPFLGETERSLNAFCIELVDIATVIFWRLIIMTGCSDLHITLVRCRTLDMYQGEVNCSYAVFIKFLALSTSLDISVNLFAELIGKLKTIFQLHSSQSMRPIVLQCDFLIYQVL